MRIRVNCHGNGILIDALPGAARDGV